MRCSGAEFVRKLGCVRIALGHLNQALIASDLTELENRSRQIQDGLIELVKLERRLTRPARATFKPRLAELRQEILAPLEQARKILDDSLTVMMTMVKAAQDAAGLSRQVSSF